MIRFLDTIYPGAVLKDVDDLLAICINTASANYGQIANSVKDVRVVDELNDDETLKVSYAVTGPMLTSLIAENLIYIEFAMKPPLVKRLEATIDDLNETVDDLLIAILEG